MPAHFLDDLTRRDTVIRLATYAVNGDKGRDRGDPVHEEVTEGRYAQWVDAKARKASWAVGMVYSSCGDLVAWMLYRLGCRDERLVNRTADEGQTPWMPGRNVTNVVSHRAYCKAGRGAEPQPGDVLYEAAENVQRTITVVKHPQAVTFDLPAARTWASINSLPRPKFRHTVKFCSSKYRHSRALPTTVSIL